MSSPRAVCEAWLWTTLTAAPGVASVVADRVFVGRAPADTPSPWVVFQMASERSYGPIGGPAVTHTLRYQVEAVAEGESAVPIEGAAAAIDAALDGASVALPGGVALTCQRIGGVPRTANYEGDLAWAYMGCEVELVVVGTGG